MNLGLSDTKDLTLFWGVCVCVCVNVCVCVHVVMEGFRANPESISDNNAKNYHAYQEAVIFPKVLGFSRLEGGITDFGVII